MNTAKVTARVGFFGNHWTVTIGDETHICLNGKQLVDALRGVPPPKRRLAEDNGPATETVEQYLARGGVIQKVGRTSATPVSPVPKPSAIPEALPTPSRLTLEFLFRKAP